MAPSRRVNTLTCQGAHFVSVPYWPLCGWVSALSETSNGNADRNTQVTGSITISIDFSQHWFSECSQLALRLVEMRCYLTFDSLSQLPKPQVIVSSYASTVMCWKHGSQFRSVGSRDFGRWLHQEGPVLTNGVIHGWTVMGVALLENWAPLVCLLCLAGCCLWPCCDVAGGLQPELSRCQNHALRLPSLQSQEPNKLYCFQII